MSIKQGLNFEAQLFASKVNRFASDFIPFSLLQENAILFASLINTIQFHSLQNFICSKKMFPAHQIETN